MTKEWKKYKENITRKVKLKENVKYYEDFFCSLMR